MLSIGKLCREVKPKVQNPHRHLCNAFSGTGSCRSSVSRAGMGSRQSRVDATKVWHRRRLSNGADVGPGEDAAIYRLISHVCSITAEQGGEGESFGKQASERNCYSASDECASAIKTAPRFRTRQTAPFGPVGFCSEQILQRRGHGKKVTHKIFAEEVFSVTNT